MCRVVLDEHSLGYGIAGECMTGDKGKNGEDGDELDLR